MQLEKATDQHVTSSQRSFEADNSDMTVNQCHFEAASADTRDH
jgi:hypothetical protein